MPDIDSVWIRIQEHESDEFKTKTGKPFSYEITGNVLNTNRTEYNLPKSDFAKALRCVPIPGPGKISDSVRGSAYIWAILHDARIRKREW